MRPHTFTPEHLLDESTVIVTTNHIGASVYGPTQDTFGDSGKDAQHLANISGCRVIGLDRPRTGNGQRYSPELADYMTKQPEVVASKWVEAIEPAFAETDACHVELVGRSAGSNLLLEVALLELLPVTAVLAVDPVAIFKMSVHQEKLRFAKYQTITERKKLAQPQNEAITLAELAASFANTDAPLTSIRRLIARQKQDIKQYQTSWATDKGYMTAALIAAKMRQTTARFAFAGHPLAGERQQLEPKVIALNGLRRPKPGEAPVLSEFVEGTTHGSFNNPKNYIAEYLKLKDSDQKYLAQFDSEL